MNHQNPTPFASESELALFLRTTGSSLSITEAIARAVGQWIQNEQAAETSLTGYQWKCLFLPSGTTLRTVYKRKSYLAHVEGSELRFEGRCVSPGQFVDEVAHCPRNAWRTVWLRYPGEVEWKQAMTLRTKTTERETKRDAGRPKE